MKINEILNESRKKSGQIDEAPVNILGQGARRAGAWALNKIGAVNTAGKLTGKANAGVDANAISKEFHTYLGRSGISAPEYEDLVDFLTGKGLTVPNDLDGKTGPMPNKVADKMILRSVNQASDLGASRRAAAAQQTVSQAGIASNAASSTPLAHQPAAPAQPASVSSAPAASPTSPVNTAPAATSTATYSQVKQMVDQLPQNSLVMLKKYIDGKVGTSTSTPTPPSNTPAATPPASKPAAAPRKPKKTAPAAKPAAKPAANTAPPAQSAKPAASKPAAKKRAPAKPTATP